MSPINTSFRFIKILDTNLNIISGGVFAQLIPLGLQSGGMMAAMHSPARKGFMNQLVKSRLLILTAIFSQILIEEHIHSKVGVVSIKFQIRTNSGTLMGNGLVILAKTCILYKTS